VEVVWAGIWESNLTGANLVASKVSLFLAELKRRKVYRVATVYVVAGAGIIGLCEAALPSNLWEGIQIPVGVIILVGLPIALILGWAYEVRPEEQRSSDPSDKEASPTPHAATPTTIPTTGHRKSIVVLPFDNMSPDPGDAYFSDGLTEEIIANLSHLGSLRVISRSSAMVLKGTQKDVRTIGRELDVQYVLEGSVRKAGDALRITAQLIDADSDEHLWAEHYEGKLDDVFKIQEDTSRAIVDALHVKINPDELKKLVERPIDDVRAYERYLRARSELHLATEESIENARRHLEAGLGIVGENGLLYQGMAELHLCSHDFGVKADDETLQQAEEFAARVVALRPNSATIHYLKGRIERLRGTVPAAAQHFEKALEIDPNHPDALVWLVFAYCAQFGRPSAADTYSERLAKIDPLSPLSMFGVGFHHLVSGRLEEALSTFNGLLALEPDFLIASIQGQALSLMWQDRHEEALEVLAPIAHREPRDHLTDYAVFLQRAIAGDSVGVKTALSEDTRNWFWNDPELPWFGASAFALAGAKDEALTWLERAVEQGWINHPLFSERDPLLESIRDEPRFKELMVGVKRDWEAFGARLKSTS